MLKNLLFYVPFYHPTAKQMAEQELKDAERSLLAAHSQSEYAASMVAFHSGQINRLKQYLHTETE